MFVDGRKAFTVPEEVLPRLGLEVGAALGRSGEGAAAPDGATDVRKAREAALRLLAVRARTRRELDGRLRKKGYPEDVVSAVLDGLEAAGLVDDRAYAALWADERMRLRPVGRRRLVQELRLRGVPPAVADEAVDRAFGENPERELAGRVARSWARRAGTGDPRSKARLFALLLRRGFSRSTAIDVVREVMGEQDG